jgi:hypothetical protein
VRSPNRTDPGYGILLPLQQESEPLLDARTARAVRAACWTLVSLAWLWTVFTVALVAAVLLGLAG